MSNRKPRKQYTAEEKVSILRRHLVDKVPVSDLCEEYGLQPAGFYRWQQEFFEKGAATFQRDSKRREEARARKLDEGQKGVPSGGRRELCPLNTCP